MLLICLCPLKPFEISKSDSLLKTCQEKKKQHFFFFLIGKSERFGTVTSIRSRLYSVLFNLAGVSVSLYFYCNNCVYSYICVKSVMLGLPLILGKSTLCVFDPGAFFTWHFENLFSLPNSALIWMELLLIWGSKF